MGIVKVSQIQQNARTRSIPKHMIAGFFEKTGHVAIVPLELRRAVTSE